MSKSLILFIQHCIKEADTKCIFKIIENVDTTVTIQTSIVKFEF